MGSVIGRDESPTSLLPETKLESKIVEAMRRRAKKGSPIRSFNTVVLKFPKIDDNMRKCKTTFEEFDEDGNGIIDHKELKHCFHKLEKNFTDEEIDDLFEACDINRDRKMEFNEFIVLLCLVYLLKDGPEALHAVSREQFQSRMDLPKLDFTFETLVDAFVFLDKNKDGYVSKNEMVQAINETAYGERSSGRIAMKRFEEMDWDKNGMVSFKEFLFAFTRWVGLEDTEDEDGEGDV